MRFPFVMLLTLLLGCGETTSSVLDAGTPDSGIVDATDPALDDFFSLSKVHTVDITVDQTAHISLVEDPRTYVRGSVAIDDLHYETIGVRLKGGAGSFISLEGEQKNVDDLPGRSAFILDFNRFVRGQKHLGLTKLTVNNMVQDRSRIHEYVGYALFRAQGVPAPRIAYAELTLNNEAMGLYLLVESQDNGVFLKRWFASKKGNLYEGEYGADLVREQIPHFDQDNGSDTSRQDLTQVVSALDTVSDPDALGRIVDLDRYLAFAATEIFLGHWDGYAFSANNYAIHIADERVTFLPWGLDQTFVDELGPYAGVLQHRGFAWHGGRIHGICMSSAPCRIRLLDAILQLFQQIDTMHLESLVHETLAVVGPVARSHAFDHEDGERTHRAGLEVLEYIARRREHIASWLPCLEGGEVDHDEDGFNGCAEDCDDFDPFVGVCH